MSELIFEPSEYSGQLSPERADETKRELHPAILENCSDEDISRVISKFIHFGDVLWVQSVEEESRRGYSHGDFNYLFEIFEEPEEELEFNEG